MGRNTLKLSDVMESADAAVKEFGKKHWTKPRDGKLYLIDPRTGNPEDLVGHTLARLGVEIPLHMAGSTVKRLDRKGAIDVDDDAYEFLLVLQDAQDDGDLWVEALILAECWMIDITLPWNQPGYIAA